MQKKNQVRQQTNQNLSLLSNHTAQSNIVQTNELVQLDRLLGKYQQHLNSNDTPLCKGILRKFKRIQRVQKIKNYKKNTNDQTKISDCCYICRQKIIQCHSFYKQMCQECGTLNFLKRNLTSNMQGKIALVTGGRIKIGYYTVLNLLRSGAYVLTTTRFAFDAVKRYMKEIDYKQFKNRIEIIQVSMNSIQSITKLTNYIIQKYKKLDILVNNAAQTIRRPKIFYQSLLKSQQYDPDHIISLKIDDYFQFNNNNVDIAIHYDEIKQFMLDSGMNNPKLQNKICEESQNIQGQCSVINIHQSSINLINQHILNSFNQKYFPPNIYDQHEQQIDLRPVNSWVRNIENTNSLQLGEVMMINCIAPFTLIQQLISIMKNHKIKTWIINVSSMQGCFSRKFKTQFHPHTNMAKAALNMMTRTCAQSFAKQNIVMLSVDTGWNTIQEPNKYDLKSPLDCIDGAARIVDPIYRNLTKQGIFYKNFQPFDW